MDQSIINHPTNNNHRERAETTQLFRRMVDGVDGVDSLRLGFVLFLSSSE